VSVAQEINLFQPELRAPAPALSARLILRAVGGLALALVLFYGFASKRADTETKVVARLETQKTETTARLEGLELQVSKLIADPTLAAEVRNLGIETETRRALVRAVEKRALGSSNGFSPQLEGLAKHTLEGVWLHQIKIEHGGEGLALAGSALNAELLPHWLEGMRDEPGLSGRAFQTVRIQPSDPDTGATHGTIDFALATGEEFSP
jgi:hypothetical protein